MTMIVRVEILRAIEIYNNNDYDNDNNNVNHQKRVFLISI